MQNAPKVNTAKPVTILNFQRELITIRQSDAIYLGTAVEPQALRTERPTYRPKRPKVELRVCYERLSVCSEHATLAPPIDSTDKLVQYPRYKALCLLNYRRDIDAHYDELLCCVISFVWNSHCFGWIFLTDYFTQKRRLFLE